MYCIVKIASCVPVTPVLPQLNELVAAGEIPNMSVCSAPGSSSKNYFLLAKKYFPHFCQFAGQDQIVVRQVVDLICQCDRA